VLVCLEGEEKEKGENLSSLVPSLLSFPPAMSCKEKGGGKRGGEKKSGRITDFGARFKINPCRSWFRQRGKRKKKGKRKVGRGYVFWMRRAPGPLLVDLAIRKEKKGENLTSPLAKKKKKKKKERDFTKSSTNTPSGGG